MNRAVALSVIAAALGGCAFIEKGQVNKYSRQVAAYEKLAPDAEALGRGDTHTTEDALEEMSDWAGYIGEQDLPPVDRQKLVDRLDDARRRYLLAAAKLANTPDLGYALARMTLAKGDVEALAVVRELADARAARRQELFATSHTYFIDLGNDPVWKTTAASASYVDGQLVSSHTHMQAVDRTGNCVFATKAFGKEGTKNSALTFRLVGDAPVYVRCYLRKDPQALPYADREWVISTSAGGFSVKGLTPASSSAKYRDFLLTPHGMPEDDGFAHLEIALSYEYSDGTEVYWDDQGVSRLRKRMLSIDLASSPVFWERGDG
jgi:hypothetical protein